LALWAEMLLEIPGARLILKASQLADPVNREDILAGFELAGIDASRLTLLGHTPDTFSHLETYHQIDVALDTIPRTGGSTTAEALWMGVPVVTLAGDRYVTRISASILYSCGLKDCITYDESAYVERIKRFADDPVALDAMRLSMRDRMRAGGLSDGTRLAGLLEDAYEEMFHRRHDRGGGASEADQHD